MATPNLRVLNALEKAAALLELGTHYQWGHMGSCNCGHLAQAVTNLSKEDIHARAMEKYGDWSEQVGDYCATSGWPMDAIISDLLSIGFSLTDLINLERLKDKQVLTFLPSELRQNLNHNKKEHVIAYLQAWAAQIKSQIANPLHHSETKNSYVESVLI